MTSRYREVMSADRSRSSDTSDDAVALATERLRAMTAKERFDLVAALNDSCDRLAAAGVRRRYPTADDFEVTRRVVALRVERQLMIDAYGWDPHIQGW